MYTLSVLFRHVKSFGLRGEGRSKGLGRHGVNMNYMITLEFLESILFFYIFYNSYNLSWIVLVFALDCEILHSSLDHLSLCCLRHCLLELAL